MPVLGVIYVVFVPLTVTVWTELPGKDILLTMKASPGYTDEPTTTEAIGGEGGISTDGRFVPNNLFLHQDPQKQQQLDLWPQQQILH